MKQKLETALVLALSLTAGVATAQVCATQPTCEGLGFTQKASDCTGNLVLKCPFDTSKVFCGGSACDSSYIYSSCNEGKGTCSECGGLYKYTSCNSGWELNSLRDCVPSSCAGAIQPSSNIPHCISSKPCKSGFTTTYGCSKCEVGYEYNLGACTPMDCYNSCYYEQGIINDSKIAAMTTTKPTCDNWSSPMGCFRNGTLVYMCSGLSCF